MSSGGFWARRQAAVAREARAEAAALRDAERAEADVALAARDDAEILEELDLPDPDTLESPQDVRDFLGSAVPQRLKTRALRRLWRLNPVLANLDGLVDYGQDFSDSANVIENMQTAYQVGKGMMSHVEALAAEAEAKRDADAPMPAAEATAEAPALEDDAPAPEPVAEDPPEPAITAAHPEAGPAAPCADATAQSGAAPAEVPRRRRMTFQFEERA